MFDHATRIPPTITEEFTESLENLIRKRIRDEAWDDVILKVKKVLFCFALSCFRRDEQ